VFVLLLQAEFVQMLPQELDAPFILFMFTIASGNICRIRAYILIDFVFSWMKPETPMQVIWFPLMLGHGNERVTWYATDVASSNSLDNLSGLLSKLSISQVSNLQ
jgi:hypothetical protein